MSLIKSLASYWHRRNQLHHLGSHFESRYHHEVRPHRLPGIAVANDEQTSKVEIANGNINNKPSSPPPQPRFPFSNWARWALGSILTIILPFWDKKWKTLLRLQGEVEMVAEAVETAAEVVEKVATITEKVSSDLAEGLPEDGKLKSAVVLVEHVSKEVAEEAHFAADIVHKVDELKQDVQMLLDPIMETNKDREKGHRN